MLILLVAGCILKNPRTTYLFDQITNRMGLLNVLKLGNQLSRPFLKPMPNKKPLTFSSGFII